MISFKIRHVVAIALCAAGSVGCTTTQVHPQIEQENPGTFSAEQSKIVISDYKSVFNDLFKKGDVYGHGHLKDKFETENDYKERLSKIVDLNKKYTLLVEPNHFDTIALPDQNLYILATSNKIILQDRKTKNGEYSGQNAYGAKTTFTSYTRIISDVAIVNFNQLPTSVKWDSEGQSKFKWQGLFGIPLKTTNKQTIELFKNKEVGLAITGRFTDLSKSQYSNHYIAATITNPEAVTFLQFTIPFIIEGASIINTKSMTTIATWKSATAN